MTIFAQQTKTYLSNGTYIRTKTVSEISGGDALCHDHMETLSLPEDLDISRHPSMGRNILNITRISTVKGVPEGRAGGARHGITASVGRAGFSLTRSKYIDGLRHHVCASADIDKRPGG